MIDTITVLRGKVLVMSLIDFPPFFFSSLKKIMQPSFFKKNICDPFFLKAYC